MTLLLVAVAAGYTVRAEMSARAAGLEALSANRDEGGDLVLVVNGRIDIEACDRLSRTYSGGGYVSASVRMDMPAVPGFRLKLYTATQGFLTLAGGEALNASDVLIGAALSNRLGVRRGAVIVDPSGQERVVAGTLTAQWLQDRSDGIFETIAPIGVRPGECWIGVQPAQHDSLMASLPAMVGLQSPRESAQKLPTTLDRAEIVARYRSFDPERGPIIVFLISMLAGFSVLATRARESVVYSSAGYSAGEVLVLAASEVGFTAALSFGLASIAGIVGGVQQARTVGTSALLDVVALNSVVAALGAFSTVGLGFVVARVLRGRVYRADV